MVKLAREMDELASDVVVYGMVPQRPLLAASCGERCLSCCAPFDMLVTDTSRSRNERKRRQAAVP